MSGVEEGWVNLKNGTGETDALPGSRRRKRMVLKGLNWSTIRKAMKRREGKAKKYKKIKTQIGGRSGFSRVKEKENDGF